MTKRDLTGVSREDLLAELLRRENDPDAAQDEQTAPWCHECARFVAYAGRGNVPDTYNPCKAGHRMQFWIPRPWEDPEHFGFYRRVCRDRVTPEELARLQGARPRPVPPKRR